jgi:hypothetical protein
MFSIFVLGMVLLVIQINELFEIKAFQSKSNDVIGPICTSIGILTNVAVRAGFGSLSTLTVDY